MEILFYSFSIIAFISTLAVVLSIYPVYALLFLIISFLSVSCIFFILGASLAGALEIVVYAGAIMVLFIFVVMMLNTDSFIVERADLTIQYDFKNILLLFIFLLIFLYICSGGSENYIINDNVSKDLITLKCTALKLFGSYIFAVEIASMLLLSSLIISLHISRFHRYNIKK